MLGGATLTAVPSRKTIPEPRTATARTQCPSTLSRASSAVGADVSVGSLDGGTGGLIALGNLTAAAGPRRTPGWRCPTASGCAAGTRCPRLHPLASTSIGRSRTPVGRGQLYRAHRRAPAAARSSGAGDAVQQIGEGARQREHR